MAQQGSSLCRRSFDLPCWEHDTWRNRTLCSRAQRHRPSRSTITEVGKEAVIMVSRFILSLLVLWLLGVVTSYTLGGFIHLLLAAAIVVAVLEVLQGRNPFRLMSSR